MAEFKVAQPSGDPTQAQAPSNAVQPQSPVVTPNNGLKAIGGLFDQVDNIVGAVAKSQQKGFVADFTNKQLAVVQGLEQGTIKTSAFARTMLRKNLIQAVNDYPMLSKDLLAANASILGNAGMGQQVTQGTKDEIAAQKLKEHLVTSGQLSPNATDEETKQVETNFQLAQAADQRYKMEMNTIGLAKAKADLSKSELDALKAKTSAAALDKLTNTMPAEMDNFKNFADTIMNSNMPADQKVQSIEMRWTTFNQGIAPYTAQVSGHQADALTKAAGILHQTLIDQASGKLSADAAKQQIQKVLSVGMQQALKDPVIANAYALSKLLPKNMPLDKIPDIQTSASKFISTNLNPDVADGKSKPADPFTIDPTERQGLSTYLSIVGKADPKDPAQVQEQYTQLTNILKGITTYSSVMKDNPKSAIELNKWFASQQFLQLRQQHPELFTNMSTIKDLWEANYADNVWGLVKNEFRDNNVRVNPNFSMDMSSGFTDPKNMKTVKTTDLVSYVPSPDGVKFVPIDPNKAAAVQKANELNQKLAPIINNTVKAMAHMNGSSDYSKVFATSADAILTGGVDGSNVFNEKDFQSQAAKAQGLAALADKTEGGGNYDTLFNNAQSGDLKGQDVSKMTIGQAIAFGNGPYHDWLVKTGAPSPYDGMGRYQVIPSTLETAAKQMGLSMSTPFNATTQDAIFNHLIGQALEGKTTPEAKRQALRNVWHGFRNVSDAKLDTAIANYEGNNSPQQ